MRLVLLVAGLLFPLLAAATDLTKEQSVVLAEKFILENGYTDAPAGALKETLDNESIEWVASRDGLLKERFNSLGKKAIGAKSGRKNQNKGWSVAFDYVNTQYQASCRVVTMNLDGSDIRLEHVDGSREFFAGF